MLDNIQRDLAAATMVNGTITASFEQYGKGKVKLMNCQHTYEEAW